MVNRWHSTKLDIDGSGTSPQEIDDVSFKISEQGEAMLTVNTTEDIFVAENPGHDYGSYSFTVAGLFSVSSVEFSGRDILINGKDSSGQNREKSLSVDSLIENIETKNQNKVEMNAQQIDKEILENAGVLGDMRDPSELDSVFGSSGLSSDMIRNIVSGGLSSRGNDSLGGGTADGLGGLGTKGRGSPSFSDKPDFTVKSSNYSSDVDKFEDKKAIHDFILSHMSALEKAHKEELAYNDLFAGKIVLSFTIQKSGKVTQASIKSAKWKADILGTKGKEVEESVIQELNKMTFPPLKGGVVQVTYPLEFRPSRRY